MTSLYVHIPFCERKCLYCDFYSIEGAEHVAAYLGALSREIALRGECGERTTFDTVFFGGGTPSLLSPRHIERILSHLDAAFRIAPDAEVTLEANPGTVTEERLRAYRGLGVNRLSVGIQSFHDAELRMLGRIHDRAEAFRAIDLARRAGFDNLGLDLIYSIPGQTLTGWEDNLTTATRLAVQHIAAYSLIVEEQTPMARRVASGELCVNPPDLEARMYERTMEALGGHGYDHYEVSNYALPGFRCRHNMAYWSHQDYAGFGPAAHSFQRIDDGTRGRRFWNVADLDAYGRQLRDDQMPIAGQEELGPVELWRERIFLELRTGRLDLARLARDFGRDLETERPEPLRHLAEAGLLVFRDRMLDLTPRGFLLCDEVCLRLSD